MIEIAFSESACGGLKTAQRYGKGEYHSNIVAVFSGDKKSEKEKQNRLREAEERERRVWESAAPLGGNVGDVYCLDLMWSVGEITEEGIGPQRRRVLEQMTTWQLPDILQQNQQRLEERKRALDTVCQRAAAGEAMRIWYSDNPDEACGLYWLMAQLHRRKNRGPIYLVKLPAWEYTEDGTVVRRTGWGEVHASEFGRHLTLQQEATTIFVAHGASVWKQLQEENASLRVMLNGCLVSVAEDIYDGFILREIERQEDTFFGGALIGAVLTKYQLGISDGWISGRLDEMIRTGVLEVVAEAPQDGPVYARMLQKR